MIKGSYFLFLFILLFSLVNCTSKAEENDKIKAFSNSLKDSFSGNVNFDRDTKTIHVLVALCDNKYQGIVPVPEKIGNGQDPNNNLYWGAMYGIKTFFMKSKEWKLLKSDKPGSVKMERLVFQHRVKNNYYLVADAYNGKNIRECTVDFLSANAGILKDTIKVNDITLGTYGNSVLLSYIGHDGLMDFELSESFKNTDGKVRNCVILACLSKRYFTPYIKGQSESFGMNHRSDGSGGLYSA